MKKLYYIIYIGILMMLLAGCRQENSPVSDGEGVTVSYNLKVDDGLQSRSMGDGTKVNHLTVMVFDEEGEYVLQKVMGWPLTGGGLNLTLFKGTYQVLFWLQYANESFQPYDIDHSGCVSVTYGTREGSLSDMESWDAFYYVDELTINNEVQTKPITLTRPLGQLNWADDQWTHNAANAEVTEVTLQGVITTFNPLANGQEQAVMTQGKSLSFSFNAFTDEKLTIDEKEYSYLSSIYLFPTTSASATFTLKQGETEVTRKENIAIAIEENKRLNILTSTQVQTKEDQPEDGPQEGGSAEGENQQGGTTEGENQGGNTEGENQQGTTGGENQQGTTEGENQEGNTGGENQQGTTEGENQQGNTGGENQGGTTEGENQGGNTESGNQGGTTEVKSINKSKETKNKKI